MSDQKALVSPVVEGGPSIMPAPPALPACLPACLEKAKWPWPSRRPPSSDAFGRSSRSTDDATDDDDVLASSSTFYGARSARQTLLHCLPVWRSSLSVSLFLSPSVMFLYMIQNPCRSHKSALGVRQILGHLKT